METWVWILIGVAVVLVVLAIAYFAVKKGRERKVEKRVEKKRQEATLLRQDAEQRLSASGQHGARAEQETERAARERAAAEENIRRAEDVDPDVPDVDRGDEDDVGARRAGR